MKRIVLGVVLSVLLLGAALQTIRMLWSVQVPMQLDYGEGIVLWQASQVFHLGSAFRPLEQYPHLVFHYTPLYHIALRMVAYALRDPLLSGRVVSMAAALWLVGLFAWTVLQATRGYASRGTRWFAALVTCAFVLQLPAMQWVPLARVDMLGLALQFTALSLLCLRRFGLGSQLVACCLLLAGVYTKQSLVALPAASILLVGLIRPGRALKMMCGLAAAGLGILLILAWATNGLIIRHWILYNVNPFQLKHALTWEWQASTNLAALIAVGLGASLVTFPPVVRGNWRARWQAVSARLTGSALRRTGLGFGLTVAFGFVTSWGIGKNGANINYCLEWQLALCPLAGVFVVLFLRGKAQTDHGMALLRPLVIVLLGVTAVQLAVQSWFDCNYQVGLTGNAREERARSLRENAELVKLISSLPGPVVSENMEVLLRAGKSIPFEPAIVKVTTESRLFDESSLLKKTSDKYFDAFILSAKSYTNDFSPHMLDAIRRNYRLNTSSNETYLIYLRQP